VLDKRDVISCESASQTIAELKYIIIPIIFAYLKILRQSETTTLGNNTQIEFRSSPSQAQSKPQPEASVSRSQVKPKSSPNLAQVRRKSIPNRAQHQVMPKSNSSHTQVTPDIISGQIQKQTPTRAKPNSNLSQA
jgi:hypothetical protein